MSDTVPGDPGTPSTFEAAEPDDLSRHAFLRIALGGAGAVYAAALGYPVYRYLASPVERAAEEAAVSEVTIKDIKKYPPGTAHMFKFGAKPGMLIHHEDGSWTALSAVCTHLGCTVQFQAEQKRIFCACHGGVYDSKTGGNLAGPPPKPLQRYEVKIVGEDAVVARG